MPLRVGHDKIKGNGEDSVDRIVKSFRQRIRRLFACLDDADQRTLIVENLEDLIQHAAWAETADTADKDGGCGSLHVHEA
jgi:hypothetical protein